jgi:hypothetical protein
MIKKYWLLLSVILFTLGSCSKKDNFDPVKQAAEDEAAIQAFIKANNLTNVTRQFGFVLPNSYAGYGCLSNRDFKRCGNL